MAEAAKWYVVHTYSGYENTVKATIEGLKSLRNAETVAQMRGKTVEEILG